MKRRVLILLCLVAAGCRGGSKRVEPITTTPASGAPAAPAKKAWPAGPARGAEAAVHVVLYFAAAPKVDPQRAFDAACKKEVAALAGHAAILRGKRDEVPPPPARMHASVARGPSEAEMSALESSKEDPWLVRVVGPAADAAPRLRAATILHLCLARATGALIWDAQTANLFTVVKYQDQRLEGWKDASDVDVRHHVMLHEYAVASGLMRLDTLGMEKFGAPDLAVSEVAPNLAADLAVVINAAAQTLADGGALEKPGELNVRLASLRSDEWKKVAAGVKQMKGTGAITLQVVEGKREEGDAHNRLMEIVFAPKDGASVTELQGKALVAFLGAKEDKAVQFEDDDEIIQAKNQARKELARFKPRWDKGLSPTQTLMVKSPFKTDDGEGTEWMWVHVTSWKGKVLRGTLDNAPEAVSSLKLGSIVEVQADEVSDYAFAEGDDVKEGYVLTKIMMRRQGMQAP